jgi:queuine tRNA-ribosyltransferase
MFTIINKDEKTGARVGLLKTKSGEIVTPFFMPVATKGSVKYITSDDLLAMKNTAVISNAFILYLKPGDKVLHKIGGIKKFMSYHGINATDSGGFQMYKESFLIETTKEGVLFRSPFDGSKHFVTPEKDMEIQININSDIAMCLDTMPLIENSRESIKVAIDNTAAWAVRCKNHHDMLQNDITKTKRQLLFAITQGGIHKDLREESCRSLAKLDVDGFSIGGLALGEPEDKMISMVKIHKKIMPTNKPCYLMGVGSPTQLLRAISLGVDMFDSRFPTQNARRGTIFTSKGKIRLLRTEFEDDEGPLDKECDCFVCKKYSRAFIRYQLLQKEGVGYRLATYHQLYYLMRLMEKSRDEIRNGRYSEFVNKICTIYANEDSRIEKLANNKIARDFHATRKMFCITKDKLLVGDERSELAHDEWLARHGISRADSLKLVRGYKSKRGDIYFYVGEFRDSSSAKSKIMKMISKLMGELGIKKKARIFGGLIKGEIGKQWQHIKDYGTIEENLFRNKLQTKSKNRDKKINN